MKKFLFVQYGNLRMELFKINIQVPAEKLKVRLENKLAIIFDAEKKTDLVILSLNWNIPLFQPIELQIIEQKDLNQILLNWSQKKIGEL